MNGIYERKRTLTISALIHYIERLKKLQTDDEISTILTHPLLTNLSSEQSEAEKIITHVRGKGFEIRSEFETKIFGKHSPMKSTLTAALLCYYHDMVRSEDLVSKKMKVGSDYSLLREEINFCREFLNSLAKNYGMDTNVS